MFLALLIVTFAISLVTCYVVARFFRTPVDGILSRIIADDISSAWRKYITFAIYVTGVSGGVRIWDLERYITPRLTPRPLEGRLPEAADILVLTTERWVLEIYRSLIQTLQSIAWMLLVFFVFALIAYVIVRISESRRADTPPDG